MINTYDDLRKMIKCTEALHSKHLNDIELTESERKCIERVEIRLRKIIN